MTGSLRFNVLMLTRPKLLAKAGDNVIMLARPKLLAKAGDIKLLNFSD